MVRRVTLSTMINYLICEIAGKQYKVVPNKPLKVAFLGDVKQIEAKVLVRADDKGTTIGNPYLKDGAKFEVTAYGKGKKIRVGKFHAKANYRRVKGHRIQSSTIILAS